MKTSHPHHRSEKCACHLNQAVHIGALVTFVGLSGGGVIMAFPASLGISPEDAQATALILSVATLVVGAIFLAVGTVQKMSDKTQTSCAVRPESGAAK